MRPTARGFVFVSFLAVFGIERPCLAQVRDVRVRPITDSERLGFDQSRKVAVLVGVGKYPTRSRIGELKYPPRDVDLLAEILEKNGYTVVALKDAEATREAVRNTLKDVGEVLESREGTLVFYFSGHGWEVEDKTASGLTIKRNLLATADAGGDNLSGSGLAVDEVIDRMHATRAKRRVIWIDACRNEPGRSAAGRTFGALNKAEGTRVLFATRPGRLSYENDQLQQGVFSHFLVRALRGEAAGPDGLVTYDDVATFVSENVENFGLRSGILQVPYEGGEYRGDFLIARNRVVVPPATSSPQPVVDLRPVELLPTSVRDPGLAPSETDRVTSHNIGTLMPYNSKPERVVQKMLEMAGLKSGEALLDFGSGEGEILITAAKDFGAKATGIEPDATLRRKSIEKIRRLGLQDRVEVNDLERLEWANLMANVVTIYSLPSSIGTIKSKIHRKVVRGTRIVTHDFELPDWKVVRIDRILHGGDGRSHTLFLYRR